MWYKNSWVELIQLPNPAAGGSATFRIPGETFAAVSHATVQLTTSAVVANRYVSLDILSGDSDVTFRAMTDTAHAASLTRSYSFAPGISGVASAAGGSVMLPFPSSLLAPGFSLRFTAVGIDAGDQFGELFLHLLRVPSGDSPSTGGASPYEG
jgi:hypothetical protein